MSRSMDFTAVALRVVSAAVGREVAFMTSSGSGRWDVAHPYRTGHATSREMHGIGRNRRTRRGLAVAIGKRTRRRRRERIYNGYNLRESLPVPRVFCGP